MIIITMMTKLTMLWIRMTNMMMILRMLMMLYLLLTLLEAMSETDRWVWMVSSWSRHLRKTSCEDDLLRMKAVKTTFSG